MKSIWNIESKAFEPLRGDAKTDVLVVGGGIAGILCAHALRQAGVDCILAESERICGGITENTTAKITSQHGLIYRKLIKKFGTEKAKMYLEANQDAVKQYRRLCGDIDCDFEEKDAYVYAKNLQDVEDELNALDKLGFKALFRDNLPLPMETSGAVCFEKQAQFHPLKFLYAIAKDLNIYEHTKITEVTNDGALTESGKISAQKVIIATHFPFLNKHGMYFFKMFQHRSYVLALKNAADVDGMYRDEDEKGLSFRNYNGLLLLGGGSHRTGEKGGNWQELQEFADTYYPKSEIVGRWATQDCMTLDGVPYIGQYSKNTPNIYVATGFNKWGMTSAMVAAQLLADLVMGKQNPYAEVFCPSRSMLRPQLAVNAAKTVLNLITPTAPRCPHLGCALKYNKQEHTWDCPCHGSRFTEDKQLIDNPATHGLK